MPTPPDPRKRRQFPAEGFSLYVDGSGVEIRVDDFHPLPLKLSWDLIEQLRREAQAPRASERSNPAESGS
jgi:hypothetical protein